MSETKKDGFFKRVLDKVEVIGNKLPQPVTLFAILMGIVLILSWIFGGGIPWLIEGTSVLKPGTGADTGVAAEYIKVKNLLTKDGLQQVFTNMVDVFATFPPLGLVLVVMLGIGVAEHTGMIAVALKVFVSKVPKYLITFSIVVAGMISSVAADAGYVVLIPMGGAIFLGMGRHPLAGIAAAFAGVSGGFGANFLPTGLDPMIAAFTEPAANLIDPAYTVNPLSNWYLMAASVPLVGIAGTWVTEKILVPRLGLYTPEEGLDLEEQTNDVTRTEKKALMWSMISVLALIGLVVLAIAPENGLLRGDFDEVLGTNSFQPFYSSLVPIMFIIFFVAGLVYGIVAKTIKTDKDVSDMTAKSMSTMGLYIVIAFVAAQFVAYFNWSNLGSVLAVKGSDGLQAIGFTGIPLLVGFILISSLVNLVMGSASAKWALLAPIFVPMLMLMGYSPETTQAAYRIGDSYSNILTPLLPYFPLVIVFAQKYVKNVGIGTLISMMLPYAIAFMIVRIPMFVAWIMLNLPLGIQGPIYYNP
ncbi:AbgT family transporter [Alkalitalea saponilacus]|uniref:Aminobenzoyl-glutamate transport protein n=1 Tax=Alkalitalea saponilacus TaxID=889453 RepID=A0A1T5CKL8_9BACT|nr:AbgT family transporter [Alkalitalea saponilacus]ASB49898.1 aminobenzoyl-glutamate transporter [Alkalitalea saponilacus]SKB60028.1 aminobenzoyl-glutamate transport protein [Alkalitalea saponilacus]